MKKRMLALAMAVLMIVSVFAAMPISAASANLSLTVESVETEDGRIVTVYAQSAEALLAGYNIELTNSDGASIITKDVVDPEGEVETYKDIVLVNEVAGLATSVDNGVVSFVYAGFVENGESIELDADPRALRHRVDPRRGGPRDQLPVRAGSRDSGRDHGRKRHGREERHPVQNRRFPRGSRQGKNHRAG